MLSSTAALWDNEEAKFTHVLGFLSQNWLGQTFAGIEQAMIPCSAVEKGMATLSNHKSILGSNLGQVKQASQTLGA